MINKDKEKFWQHIRTTAKATGIFDKKMYAKVGHCTYWLGKKVIIFMTEPLESNIYEKGAREMDTFTITINDLIDKTKKRLLKWLEAEEERDPELDFIVKKMPNGEITCSVEGILSTY